MPVYRLSPWSLVHATFYGNKTASATMGARGYGNLFNNGYGVHTAALSSTLFNNGYACGTCYKIKCVRSPWCFKGSSFSTVMATNICPSNWSQDSNNGGWCNPPRTHLDMAKPTFMKIAQWNAGIVPVMYQRVTCIKTAGGGDIASMWVKGSKTGWISMSHNWGASYQAFTTLKGEALSFKLTSYTSRETIITWNVAPPNRKVGLTYKTMANFH